ncbi:GNAT family N-acetyltransferase [Brumimicrobium aurantiacum]|uniref:GNAT family N-acetyltransferase n=1 Tax=Brumimicrobium aurantiacum TaxID=1737063 RepID=A0A3E1EZJ4_9FLAO|nr:GNAT family N-acetyltransferase [Brumimicrobium aurantiacum]RFC54992.1 GNAT family N-acetyltransferase [Brumimicrobium aurantiacum]
MSDTVEKIIDPIDRQLLKNELTKERFGRNTRKGGNEIYIVNHHNSPNLMREIGRLRELSFRSSGGGTKKSIDIDQYDTCENCYEQLIVWSPEDEEIIGGLRFIDCAKILNDDEDQFIPMSTSHYFNFSKKFKQEFLPYAIELGRSWVQPNYQPSVNPRKGLFALDNLWDGLGVLTVIYPKLKYFFGKVTMYPDYHEESRDFLLYFLQKYFPDNDGLATSMYPLDQSYDEQKFRDKLDGLNFKEGFKVLTQFVRENGENVPPLMNIYMHLSPTMRSFGTAVNPDFGGVEETGIVVTIDDIYEDKKDRHIKPLLND